MNDIAETTDRYVKPVDQVRVLAAFEREHEVHFRRRQFIALTRRHRPDDLVVLHVLADNHHHAVLEARGGRVSVARTEMDALDAMEPSLHGGEIDLEIDAVYRLSALPVWALIRWLEGSPDDAIELLRSALRVCVDLAITFGHEYLTAKRIHLAANIARVLLSMGRDVRALAHMASLRSVVSGDREAWPFEGRESLVVPLEGVELQVIEYQLSRIESRIRHDE